eukprot:scaffold7402_cov160-Ochromonas_danica.AAC.2
MKKLMKALPAAVGAAALIFGNVDSSLALSSGSRSGGSSFRSSSSYSPSRLNSYSPSYSSPIITAPIFSPIMPMPFFMPSPFSFGFGFGFGGGPISFLFNMITFAAVASVLWNVFARTGGSSFSGDVDSGSLGNGATVIKLQVALDEDWAANNNIMNTLATIAARQGTGLNQRAELSSLLSEASLALLRRQNDWRAATIAGERFKGSAAAQAEPYFQKTAITERTKFERESLPSIQREDGMAYGPRPTQAVVSLIVAVRGQSEALRRCSSVTDLRSALQSLASEALTDEGENVMAVELLWTPSERGDVLSKKQLILDYPELLEL